VADPTYASIDDLYRFGLQPMSVQNVPMANLIAELEAASRYADSKMRARYSLPLLAWDTTITMHVCRIAAYNILVTRGYNPEAGADVAITQRHQEALEFFDGVERQRTHPNVTQTANPSQPVDLPQVITGVSRGWQSPTGGV
jgi:phage gp36-like protein